MPVDQQQIEAVILAEDDAASDVLQNIYSFINSDAYRYAQGVAAGIPAHSRGLVLFLLGYMQYYSTVVVGCELQLCMRSKACAGQAVSCLQSDVAPATVQHCMQRDCTASPSRYATCCRAEVTPCMSCRESLLCSSSQEHSGSASPCAEGSRYPSVGRSKSCGRGMATEDSQMSYCYGEQPEASFTQHDHQCFLCRQRCGHCAA